jgi:M6 family metalloprotease-like protein
MTKMRVVATLLLIVFLAAWAVSVGAISANPAPFRVTQPGSGKNITLRLMGGEHVSWLAVGDGIDAYAVVRNPNNGEFVYAELQSDGTLGPSSNVVGEVDPEARRIPKNLVMSDEARDRVCKELKLRCADKDYNEGFNETRRLQKANTPSTGDIKNLVVLMRWSDHKDRTLPSVDDIDVLMNFNGPHPLAPTGSVRDVYMVNSYGKLNLTSTVYKWVDMDNTEKYYADGTSGGTIKIQQAIKYALEQLEADSSFDFGDFDQNKDGYIDAIAFLHSGYGAETGGFDSEGTYYEDRIWSHKWDLQLAGEFRSAKSGVKVFDYHISPALWGKSGSRIGRIGVIAHETGHFFGLPDLYDTGRFGQGIGSWCLMANSWGFDGTQYYPPQLSAWARLKLGWDNFTLIEEDRAYSIAASEILEEVRDPRIYKIEKGFPKG